jgi:hypothetical protein
MLVIRSVKDTNGLSAHVSLLFDKLFKAELHCVVSIILRVNHEHGLDEYV